MKKIYEYTCPECGNDIENEVIDMCEDIDCITKTMSCGKCGLIWREYFKVTYDGYSYNRRVYDANGDIAEV